jgi:lipopolysaccharide transport system ATP-binding protein
MSTSLAIRCEGVGKRYALGERSDIFTFAEFFTSKFRKSKQKDHSRDDSTFWALQNLDFELEKGKVLGIVGRNGSGKSTLLKILSRITPPTTGSFGFNGSMASLLEVGTGFKQELSGLDNIFLSGTSLGLKRRDIKARLDEIIDFAEIEQFIHTPVKRYSSGMYVRLAFAVAAHLEPDILLLDEVLAVGDQKFQRKCLSKMKSVAGEGRTVLFVSHNMQAVTQLCDEALLLNQGQCLSRGAVDDVVKVYVEQNRDAAMDCGELQYERPTKSNGAWIRQVNIANDSGSRLHFDIMEDILLSFDVVVEEEFEDLQMILFISSPEGVVYASSREPDGHNISCERENRKLNIRTSPGEFNLRTVIKAPMLNTGFYEFHFALVGHHSVVVDEKKNIQIEIHDHQSSFSSCVNHKRAAGDFVMPLMWSRD